MVQWLRNICLTLISRDHFKIDLPYYVVLFLFGSMLSFNMFNETSSELNAGQSNALLEFESKVTHEPILLNLHEIAELNTSIDTNDLFMQQTSIHGSKKGILTQFESRQKLSGHESYNVWIPPRT